MQQEENSKDYFLQMQKMKQVKQVFRIKELLQEKDVKSGLLKIKDKKF